MSTPTGQLDACSIGEFLCEREYRYELQRFKGERRRLWQVLPLDKPIPNAPCCYVVFLDGRLAYVGSTEHLRHRLAKHFWKNPDWLTRDLVIKFKTTRRFGEWAMTEIRLLKRLKPPLNKTGKTTRRFGFE